MNTYHDLLAYGQHLGVCRIRETVPRKDHRPPLHPHDCSCGFDKALGQAREAAASALSLQEKRGLSSEGDGLDWRGDVRHALTSIGAALDKASYGDSVESDLLEAHATLDSLIGRPIGLDVDRLANAMRMHRETLRLPHRACTEECVIGIDVMYERLSLQENAPSPSSSSPQEEAE